jgi:effector-binding domain-containing protein/uncharacterized protein YndB with AHSA1/START domain
MKVLKILGVILLLLIAAYLMACAMGPNELRLERSVDIEAPVEKVFSHVSSMEAQHNWSPWAEKEPNGKYTYEGEKGAVGSVYRWEGTPEITGSGSQTIKAVEKNKRIDSRLVFTVPDEGEANAYIAVKAKEDGGTATTWGFVTDEIPFPGRGPVLLFGAQGQIEKMLGPDYEKGLQNLKKLVESSPSSSGEYSVNMQDMEAMTLVGQRKRVSLEEMKGIYAQVLPATAAAFAKAGVEQSGMPVSLTYEMNEEEGMVDMFLGIPAPAGTNIDGFVTIEKPKGKAAVIDYYGPYENLMAPHEAMGNYLAANNLTPSYPVMEIYESDPVEGSDPNTWLTKVVYYLE